MLQTASSDPSPSNLQLPVDRPKKLSIRPEFRSSILQKSMVQTPSLHTPKNSGLDAKNPPASAAKPRNLDPIQAVPPSASLSLTPNPSVTKQKEYSDFLVDLYKNPTNKSDVFSKSFVSFRNLADMQRNQSTGSESELGESFVPSFEAPSWKSKLEQNKKHESLFKSTVQDMFRSTQNNFDKMIKDNQRRRVQMPRVKVYTNSTFYKPDKTKTTETEGDAVEEEVHVIRHDEKIPEYQTRIRLAKDEPYKFYLKLKDDQTMRRPNAREGATLTMIGKKAYLYGGVSKEAYNEWEVLNPEGYVWEKMTPKGDIPTFGRLGHSADAYLNSVVVFGGEKSYNTVLKLRECLSDTRLYMTNTNEWKYMKTHGEFVEPRRNHVGIVVGRHLVVHGGIDSQGRYLSDLRVLNLSTGRWLEIEEENKDFTGIAFHKACLVLSIQRKEVNFFKMPELKPDDNVQQVKEEGIYFFGGKTEADEPVNTLRVLRIGATPFKWITPVTQGKAPDARYLHTMVHNRRFNMLIVHGGRSDGHPSIKGQPYMGDFHVFQLENFVWVSVIVRGIPEAPRCSHTAVMMGTKMIIFGGIQYNYYCSPDPVVVEIDQKAVKELEVRDRKIKEGRRETTFDTKRTLTQDRTYDGMVSFLPMPLKPSNNRILKEISPKGGHGKGLVKQKNIEFNDFDDF